MSDLAELLRRVELLEQEQVAIREERDAYHAIYLETLERCRKLELGLRGQKSERLTNDAQLSLDMLGMMLAETGKTPVQAGGARDPSGHRA